MAPTVPNSQLAAPASGTQDLDQLHQQLAQMIQHTLALSPAALLPAYPKLVAAVESDFRAEERLMESFQCADAALHRAQHARMLAGLHHAAAALEQGEPQPARQAMAALRHWLEFHSATQDRHLQRQLKRTTPRTPQGEKR